MPDLELQPFSDEHLDAAAALLAERHRRHRAAEPLLPEDVDVRAEIESLLAARGASGTTAVREDRVVGYLIGAPRADPGLGPERVGRARRPRGRGAGGRCGTSTPHAAERWVDDGLEPSLRRRPGHRPELVDAWFRLAFGQQQALRDPRGGGRAVAGRRAPGGGRATWTRSSSRCPSSIVTRAVRPSSPRGRSPIPPTSCAASSKTDMESGELANSRGGVDGRVVGILRGGPGPALEHARWPVPTGAGLFPRFAIVAPEARGSGAGVALAGRRSPGRTSAATRRMVTDWRVTNLLASRFWPRRGFRTSFLRLYRSIP